MRDSLRRGGDGRRAGRGGLFSVLPSFSLRGLLFFSEKRKEAQEKRIFRRAGGREFSVAGWRRGWSEATEIVNLDFSLSAIYSSVSIACKAILCLPYRPDITIPICLFHSTLPKNSVVPHAPPFPHLRSGPSKHAEFTQKTGPVSACCRDRAGMIPFRGRFTLQTRCCGFRG